MTYAIVALALICVLLVVVIFALLKVMRDQYDAQDRALQTMADRVQAPERVPIRDDRQFIVPELEHDEWNRVGEIDYTPAEEPVNG